MKELWNLSTNYTKAFYAWYTGRLKCNYLPLAVMIEPTNYCNLRCPICESCNMSRDRGFMDFKLFKEIIKKNYKIISKIYLHYYGESLLATNLCKMIRYAANFGIPCIIETNATLLNNSLIWSLIKSGLKEISFSFDGLTKEYYENIRRGANYEDTLKRIKEFLKIKKQLSSKEPFTYLQIINVNFTKRQVKECFKKFKDYGFDRIDIVPIHRWRGIKLQGLDSIDRNISNYKYYRCFMPWILISILWDGRVTACCDDFNGEYIIGNIKHHRLLDIWNGEKIIALRSMIVKRENIDILPCKNCFRPWVNPFKFPILEYIKRELYGYAFPKIHYFLSNYTKISK